MRKKLFYLVPFLFCLLTFSAEAKDRTTFKWGFYIDTTSPSSGLYILNLKYYMTPHWSLHVGEEMSTTVGTAFQSAQALPGAAPATTVSPVSFGNPEMGAYYTMSPAAEIAPFLGLTVIDGASFSANADAGVDWCFSIGFGVGLLLRIPLASISTMGASIFAGWNF